MFTYYQISRLFLKKFSQIDNSANFCTTKGQSIADEQKIERICDGFLIPLLEGSSSLVMSEFFGKNIRLILNCVELRSSALQKVISMKLLAQLYANADKHIVNSKSNITDAAMDVIGIENKDGREMSKYLVKQLKSIRIDSNQSFKARNMLLALDSSCRNLSA